MTRPRSHELRVLLRRHHQAPTVGRRRSLLLTVQVPGQQGRGSGIPAVRLAVEPVRHVLLQRQSRAVPSVDFGGGLNRTCEYMTSDDVICIKVTLHKFYKCEK